MDAERTNKCTIECEVFRQALADIPAEQKAQFELSFAIADRIDALLKAKGMSQKKFAELLGKRESEISKWLTGRHNFTLQTIAKIETALNCKLITIPQF
jgi:ribosome-binding protein aMBF1 (putative translation factor)